MSRSKEIAELNEQAWKLKEKDRDKAFELASQALKIAEVGKDNTGAIIARLTLADVACFRMELDAAEEHIAYVQSKAGRSIPRKIMVRLYHQQCYLLYQRSAFLDLIEKGHEMLEFIDEKGFEKQRAWVCATMGMAYQRLGNGMLALESYRKAEVLLADLDDLGAFSNIKMSIGTALAELGKRTEALEMLQESLNARLAVGGDFHGGMILGNMAKIQSQLGGHSKALQRWTESIDYLKRAGGMPLWAQAIAGKADTLRQMKRFPEAEEQLLLAIAEAKDAPAPIKINLYLPLSRIYMDEARWDESETTLISVQELMNEGIGHTLQVELHSGFYTVYKAKNDYQKALYHHEQMTIHREKHLNDQSVTQLAEWETRYQMERLRIKDEKLTQKTGELETLYKTTSVENDILLDKLANYDVLLDEMLGKLPDAHKGRFARLVRAARKENMEQDSDQLVQNRIAEKHPDLTPAELRTCGMIVHGWSSKEISDRTRTSLKNIEKHRGAIRKKTGIPRSVSLQVYLSGVAKMA